MMQIFWIVLLCMFCLTADTFAEGPTGNIVPWPADFTAGYQKCCQSGCVSKLSHVIRPEPLTALCSDVCQCSQRKLEPVVSAETLTRQALQNIITPEVNKAMDVCVGESLNGKDLNAMRLPLSKPNHSK